jgi:lysophospholipase L1-like esterase
MVFYDENGNGVPDANEIVRLPGVTVTVANQSGVTAAGGHAVVANVPAGPQSASVRADSLPPYFAAGAAVLVQAPQPPGSEIAVPVTLAIGSNRANTYMGFGDSITAGDGSSDGSGYLSYLSANLSSFWGRASLVNEGQTGTRSNTGAIRIGSSLVRVRPAYTIILYGTNDWNDIECRDDRFPCYTVNSLLSIIQDVKSAQSHPILGTIIPVNPAFTDRDSVARNDWVKRMNDLIRTMAKQQGVAVADQYAVFTSQSDLSSLYSDFLHPNDKGYVLMAQEFARAITRPLSATTTSRRRSFFFSLGG